VQIERGSPDSPTMSSGSVIGLEQTATAVDLDEVLNSIDEPTGQGLAAFLTTLGNGMDGRGANADRAIKALQPAMNDTDLLVDILSQQSRVIGSLVDDLQPLVGSVATDRGARLDDLLAGTDQVLGAVAERQQDFDATLAQLPSTLREGRSTLRALRQAADATTPMLAGMRPTTDVLTQLSAELAEFSSAGEPALKALEPTLARARTLLEAAGPLVQSLGRSAPNLEKTAQGIRPVAVELLGNLRNVLDFAKFWALTTNNADGLSNYFRSHAVVTAEPLTGLLPASGNRTPATNPGPLGGLGSTLNGLLGGLPLTDALPKGLTGGLLGSLGLGRTTTAEPTSRQSSTGNLTGLTAQQEQSMITYLLGGN
jgi:phospholipid/cholesterol/gamma-HCH transport system substrate-binding protein